MAAGSAVRSAAGRAGRMFDIFVAEVPWTVSSKELREYFSQFGPVQRCQLPFTPCPCWAWDTKTVPRDYPCVEVEPQQRVEVLPTGPKGQEQGCSDLVGAACVTAAPGDPDRSTGFHKRFCWIKFSSPEGVQNVFQKDSHILEGAKLFLRQQRGRRSIQPKKESK